MKNIIRYTSFLAIILIIISKETGYAQCQSSLSLNTTGSWHFIDTIGTQISSSTPLYHIPSPPANWLGNESAPATMIFTRSFFVGDAGNYTINFSVAADNQLDVYIDNQSAAGLIYSLSLVNSNSFTMLYTVSVTRNLNCGAHSIIAVVRNQAGTYGGFIMTGAIQGECLSETPIPCPVPQPCCNNKFPFWTNIPYPESYSFDGGTYSIEDFNIHGANMVPITEIRATVESFQLLSKYEDCMPCKMAPVLLGSIGSLWNIGTGANMLTVQTNPYGNITGETNLNEVIWKNPNGATLNSNDIIKLMYILPPESDIPCCVDSAKVCIRFSYKDVNCGYCEVYNCSTIALKKNVKPGDGKGRKMKNDNNSIIDNLNLKLSDNKQKPGTLNPGKPSVPPLSVPTTNGNNKISCPVGFTMVNGKCILNINESPSLLTKAENFTWTLPEIVNQFGYREIFFKKGNYLIVKNEDHPYGKVVLDVAGGDKLDEKMKLVNKSVVSNCHPMGGKSCDKPGYSCLVISPSSSIRLSPVLQNNNIIKLELEFLSEGITNGTRFNDSTHKTETAADIGGEVGLTFYIGKGPHCSGFGICLHRPVEVEVNIDLDLSNYKITHDGITGTTTLIFPEKSLIRNQPDKLEYFKGKRSIFFEETWEAPAEINDLLKTTKPIVINKGTYPIVFENGEYKMKVQKK